ncbi:Erythromycin esterase [anaerobic digester metagenome]
MNGPSNTLDDWIASESFSFSLDADASLDLAVDRMIAALDTRVTVLGLGEALHGGEALLAFRNRLFFRLVEAHGFSAIAIESDFLRGRLVDDYIAGTRPGSLEDVCEAGFSHGFGRLEANRELVEWMRQYNRDLSHPIPIRFYGVDSPTEMTHAGSPRALLSVSVEYLHSIEGKIGDRERYEHLLTLVGDDTRWENPAAMMDPAQSVGLSPETTALRAQVEDLVMELRLLRPVLVTVDEIGRYREALFCAEAARWLLSYHAEAARTSEAGSRIIRMLGMRDVMMADTIAFASEREEGRGRVLVFAHNSHLARRRAEWQLGPHHLAWWPAGAHLDTHLGAGYAVIGSGVVVSEANGIGLAEVNSLEERLFADTREGVFIPTHRGRLLDRAAVETLESRSRSRRNTTYFPLTPGSIESFDGLFIVGSTEYARGGPPLPTDDTPSSG